MKRVNISEASAGFEQTTLRDEGGPRAACLPDALVECAQLGHQFRGSFVLITAQIVNGFDGLRRRLQLILVDAHSLVLKTPQTRW